ncbi:MAG: cbb3-type cytochrome c oxidase subunit I [Proteobacteria bacterium]|jgi:cytochrome c oxidase subunit 1|nr:cbb3-type cytochrome c oxidase subunit I [Pseudomonadota bacterium]
MSAYAASVKPAPFVTPDTPRAKFAFQLYAAVGISVFLLMMVAGVIMRAGQGAWLGIPPNYFYEVLTLHGAGMVGTAGLAGAAVMWYFLRRYVELSNGAFLAMMGLSLVGVVLILLSIGLGGFAGAWTFLYPLPGHGMGLWGTGAAATFMIGYLAIGVGFLVFYADCALAIIRRYGSLARGLGLDQLISGKVDPAHPAAVVASTMAVIVNVLGILGGAIVLVMTLVALYEPGIAMDPLLMKNLIYFFGHVFINVTIYMAVIGVYEIIPRYTGRPWKVNRAFLGSWAAVVLLVLSVYPHHLLMDYAMPRWAAAMGQIVSYLSGIPVILVTAWGALVNLHRSGAKWDTPLRLVVLGVFGWAAGVIPAIVDATIRVNLVMHNTLWVPGHFHFYLLLGMLPMVLGTLLYACTREGRASAPLDKLVFWGYAIAGVLFCGVFLDSGVHGIARRFATYDAPWIGYAQAGAVAGTVVLVCVLFLGGRILARLPRASLAA